METVKVILSVEDEVNYFLAEQVLDKLFQEELISLEEMQEIHRLNLQNFCPILAELMV